MKPRIIFFSLLLLTISACIAPKTTGVATAEPITFTLLQLNDVYEIAPLEGGKAGGLARVATVRQELLKEDPNVITVMSGDFLSPSFLGTMKFENKAGEREKIAGLQMVETLNAMGLDYATFGNHEFDIKDPVLLEKRIAQSDFVWTVCNASFVGENGGTRPFMQGEKPVPPYAVHTITNPNGQSLKLGLLAVLLPFNQIDYVKYTDVNESFRRTLAELQPVSDLQMAITHNNLDEDIELAEAVPGLPLFMGGHEHANLSRYVGNTIITKADANAKTVYIHRVRYDPVSKMTTISSELKTIDDTIAEEPKTKAVVDKWLAKAFTVMEDMGYDPSRKVLTLNQELVCKESLIRTSQTNYGQLTMDAIAAAIPGADVYFINSGTMRLDDNLSGVVTEYDILRTYPFGGQLVSIEMPGNALLDVLKTGLEKNWGEGGYLQVKNVGLADYTVDGKAIDPAKTYTVVLPEFVAKGYEANLEVLGEYYKNDGKKELMIDGETVNNDIRDLVIRYMLTLGEF